MRKIWRQSWHVATVGVVLGLIGPASAQPKDMTPGLKVEFVDAFVGMVQQQAERCYVAPSKPAKNTLVWLELRLEPDGRLTVPPRVVKDSGDPEERAQAKAVVKALLQCEPYKIHPSLQSHYEKWKRIVAEFDLEEAPAPAVAR